MRCLRAFVAIACTLIAGISVSVAQEAPSPPYEGPIIDVHLHASTADMNGPAPNAVCVGIAANLQYDSRQPWPEKMYELTHQPPCEDPIEGPATDGELISQTIKAMRDLNVTGVLSGRPGEIEQWLEAAPDLFIPGYALNIRREDDTPEEVRAAFTSGKFSVLAEVTNQYRGVLSDDPDFAPYWAMAADEDIPVGIHLGIGPPGSPMLYEHFRIQSPLRMETVLNRHPNLRVYLMHAGFPFTDDLKAMLYLYPQLYVDTGVLQIATPREEYYNFLQELVDAGFIDRIMFGSDQMNWPGMIEEGIDAINEAPFLTYEEKKDILHDNAVRFFRLEVE